MIAATATKPDGSPVTVIGLTPQDVAKLAELPAGKMLDLGAVIFFAGATNAALSITLLREGDAPKQQGA